MEEGFVLDHSHGALMQAEWVEGPPKRSFWTGLTVRGTVRYNVTTYRCPACGYLESYARAEDQVDA
jgi:hypothetical protein